MVMVSPVMSGAIEKEECLSMVLMLLQGEIRKIIL
jgi:hypothetical protein